MTSTADRLRLYEHAKETWGDQSARTLMDLLPADPSQLATKADLGALGTNLRAEMVDLGGELRGEMAELRGELRGQMAELRGELREEMAELRGELRGEMAELRLDLRTEMAGLRAEVHQALADQTRTLATWMIAMAVTCVTFSVGSVVAAAALA